MYHPGPDANYSRGCVNSRVHIIPPEGLGTLISKDPFVQQIRSTVGIGQRSMFDRRGCGPVLKTARSADMSVDSVSREALARELELNAELLFSDKGQAVLEGIELGQKLASRIAASRAYRRKYYSFFTDKVKSNRAGDLRGITLSKKYRVYHETLGKVGVLMSFVSLADKSSQFQWRNTSAKGRAANVAAALSQWATEEVFLSGPEMISGAIAIVGSGAGRLGMDEVERDFKRFSNEMDDVIETSQKAIAKVMSVANARDALTLERSVINWRNWSLLADEIVHRGHEYHDGLSDLIYGDR